MPRKKNAIISVFDKTNLSDIANFLIKKNFTIYSTGGSSQYLKKLFNLFVAVNRFSCLNRKDPATNILAPASIQVFPVS